MLHDWSHPKNISYLSKKNGNWLAVSDINPVCKQISKYTTHNIFASYTLTSKLVWNVSVSSFDSTSYLNIIINRIAIYNITFDKL